MTGQLTIGPSSALADKGGPLDRPDTHRPEPIRLVLVDDHQMLADSLSHALGRQPDIEVVGVAGSIKEGVRIVDARQPDVVLLDQQLPDGDGVSATRLIEQVSPQSKVIMLTGEGSEALVASAMGAGCRGFVVKSQPLPELLEAVRVVFAGGASVPPRLLIGAISQLRFPHRRPGDDLSARERQILRLVAEGLGNQAIADQLYLSLHTVRNHVKSVLAKLDVHSRLGAVALANREGLLHPSAPTRY
jgi:DNA-binding NarL/FixJ family response regulator